MKGEPGPLRDAEDTNTRGDTHGHKQGCRHAPGRAMCVRTHAPSRTLQGLGGSVCETAREGWVLFIHQSFLVVRRQQAQGAVNTQRDRPR